jgi:hypothetical protein
MSKTYLSSAGSVLTAGSRHNGYISNPVSELPFPILYDDHFDFDAVHTLAAPFIVSCPLSNPKLPIRGFPALTVQASNLSDTTITLSTPGYALIPAAGKEIYAAFITAEGPIFAETTPVEGGFEAVVPSSLEGRSYVILTRSNEVVDDDTAAAGPALIEVRSPCFNVLAGPDG